MVSAKYGTVVRGDFIWQDGEVVFRESPEGRFSIVDAPVKRKKR